MGIISDLFSLSVASKGRCVAVHEGVAFFIYTGSLESWDKRFPDVGAIFRGRDVLVRSEEDYTPSLVKHELKHFDQMRRCGGALFFWPLYWMSMLKAKIKTGDAHNNAFELEALAAAEEE